MSKLRIAYSPDLNGHGIVSSDVSQLLNAALGKIEGYGNVVDEVLLQTSTLNATFRTLRGLGFLAQYSRMQDEVRQHLKPTILENAAFGKTLTVENIADAQINRSIIFNNISSILNKFDVIACPVVGLAPGPLEEEYPTLIGDEPLGDYLDWLRFSTLQRSQGCLPSLCQ